MHHAQDIEYRGTRLLDMSDSERLRFTGHGLTFEFEHGTEPGYILKQVTGEINRNMGRRYRQ
ncbi:MAG: hypothetical protein HYW27_03045 [Candidatus Aenigmarchaeota archaeon]|nr:hypothetical protein [Candidatus Aenigmarchaeota archaeon]